MIASEKTTATMLKLTHPPHINPKNKLEDDELGVFGAEKYFTGAIDEEFLRTSSNNKPSRYRSKIPQEERSPKTPSATPTVRSESSWNSRKGLLVSSRNDHRKKTSFKNLLANLGCNCNDKDSVMITDNKVHVKEAMKEPVKAQNNVKREDCFSFPVLNLNSSMADGSHSQVFRSPVLEKAKKSFSLERKLTMLNWDGVTPIAEVIDSSRNGGHDDDDGGSDASSDLFEIDSFSTNENNSFLAQQETDNNNGRPSDVNGYSPSEASVDWSVVTAGTEDITVSRGKGTGILSGCTSLKAVRVSGGGGKAAVMVSPTRREWCHRLDSVTPVAKIQADTKLIGAGHASHYLYIQQ